MTLLTGVYHIIYVSVYVAVRAFTTYLLNVYKYDMHVHRMPRGLGDDSLVMIRLIYH